MPDHLGSCTPQGSIRVVPGPILAVAPSLVVPLLAETLREHHRATVTLAKTSE
jgi:hypothetical protein